MKRILAAFIIFVYLLFSGGIVLNQHFCGGELVSTTISSAPKICDDCTDSDGCCQNIIHKYQPDDAKTSSGIPIVKQFSSLWLSDYYKYAESFLSNDNLCKDFANAKPPGSIYLLRYITNRAIIV